MSINQSKVALVTGAARRIGAGVAHFLHDHGFNVILHYNRSQKEAEQNAAQACKKRPNSMQCIQADLRDLTQVSTLAECALACWGRVDVLINNASCFYPTALGAADSAMWDDVFNTNVKSAFFLSQALVPALREAQGNIINITDIHAQMPLKGYSVYSISKAALHMMTQSLARELAPHVRVNAIAPGITLWPDEKASILSEHEKQHLLSRTPMQSLGDPQQIAATVLYIVEQAHYMTGDVITLDGGRHLQD